MSTLGLVANIYNEANALPGWLDIHLPLFDDVRVFHSGPNGAFSNDGTMEILKRQHIPYTVGSINDGFGTVRTQAIRSSPCDWVMILDADERFYGELQVLTCDGESTPPEEVDALLYDYGNPNFEKDGPKAKQVVQAYDRSIDFDACPSNFENMALLGANLRVKNSIYEYSHIRFLRRIIEEPSIDAVRIIRRHWHDFSFKKPTQNWHTHPDFQIRIVRNNGCVGWDHNSRMHERLIGATNIYAPNHTRGPFFEHMHLYFKRLEVNQRKHDIAIYNAINEGKVPPTWEEFTQGGK